MNHPTPAEIEEYLSRREGSLDTHLETCIECARIARSIKAFGDPLTWEISSLPDQADLDRAIPSEAIPRVLRGLERAEKLRNADPATAVGICNELLELPECSSASEEGRHFSVLVLRERANALRLLGELRAALDTIASARILADELIISEYENAILDYVEATVLFEQDQLEPTENLAKGADLVLTRFGDTDRASKARLLVAAVQYVRGDYELARRQFSQILESIGEGENPAIRAGLLHNLADSEIRLGRFDEARVHMKSAAELYRTLGMLTELTRLSWLDARIARGKDELDRAEVLFREAESGFRNSGFKLDAALVSLELVELYELQERRDLVVATATRLASVFAETGTRMGLATALATLRDAAVRGEDVMAPVSVARTTIEELMSANG